MDTITINNSCSSGCTAPSAKSFVVTGLKNAGNARTINSSSFAISTTTSLGYVIDSSGTLTSNDLTIVANSFTSATWTLPSNTATIKVGNTESYEIVLVTKHLIPANG